MRSDVYKTWYDSLSMYCNVYKVNVYISGHFGCVYRGYLEKPNVKGSTLVAVKTLHRKFILILASIMTFINEKKNSHSVTVLGWTIENSDSINIS